MSEHNMLPIDLSGKRCKIQNVLNLEEGLVYRIVSSGTRSNSWKELPLGRYGDKTVLHDHVEDIVYVVCDTLIDEHSEIERVALKDIEIMPDETIPLNKVKEAREKITNLEVQIQSYDNDDPMVSQAEVLAILDELIESEK